MSIEIRRLLNQLDGKSIARASRNAAISLAAVLTGAVIMAGAPSAAHAETTAVVRVGVHAATLKIPYGGQAPDERIFVATNDYEEDNASVRVDVDLIAPSGAVTRIASALSLGDYEYDDTEDDFPNGPYGSYGAIVSVPGASLAAGRYTVRATPLDSNGVEGGRLGTATFNVMNATPPAITSVSVHPQGAVVFPTKDGYRDSEDFVLHATTATGNPLMTTGTAVLKRGKHTIKVWRFNTSATRTVTWNGRDDRKVKPGVYRITYTQRGPAGPAQSATSTVRVDGRSLQSHSIRSSYAAMSVLSKTFYDYSINRNADCTYNQLTSNGGRVPNADYCSSYDDLRGGYYDYIAVAVPGSVPIPRAVQHAVNYGPVSASVGQHTSVETGHAYVALSAGGASRIDRVYDGYSSSTLRWDDQGTRLRIGFDLGVYSQAGVRDYVITWHYRTLG